MKQIPLTQGQYAIVDDADYDWLNQWKWYAHNRGGNFYASRMSSARNGKRFNIQMSRQILRLERGDKRQVDHINHTTLDNYRVNLRICTNQQNTMNQKPTRNTSSQFKGVHWSKVCKKWIAQILHCGDKIYLGLFSTEKKAALAYNKAAKKYYGEFACLNQILKKQKNLLL